MRFTRILAGMTIAALCMLNGCGLLDREPRAKPGDLTLELAPGVRLYMVWLEPMQLLVGRYEVTNRQYRQFNAQHDSGTHRELSLDHDDQPVVNVSWNDANNFCKWLTEKFGRQNERRYIFRLPTEAEWMTYAASGRDTEYPWGDDWPPPKSWNYFGRENPEPAPKIEHDDGHRVSAPVRRSGVNDWRLYGVGGNVWEWCSDRDGDNRVIKGASWADSAPLFLRMDRRSSYAPNYRYVNLGFRVVAERVDQPAATPDAD